MLHFLAYGNSDQESFRNSSVRKCFDVMTVPSTIASYYPDATAAFVLSSELDYMIEPRTPLFQEELPEPRASHYTLANVMGGTVSTAMQRSKYNETPAVFPPDFYTNSVCEEVVKSMIAFQRGYGSPSETAAAKLERYRKLLFRARGISDTGAALTRKVRGPSHVLCPYFAVYQIGDEWWSVMDRIWQAACREEWASGISPVVALRSVDHLTDAVRLLPPELSSTVFFWVPGFDERKVPPIMLRSLRKSVAPLTESYELINLYGGYFSILLGKFGLYGFNNGLGYSESRDWPTLDSTGAAPPRYYVRRLHAYLPVANAARLIQADRTFSCDCNACQERGAEELLDRLDYHDLKRHFALARRWELDQVESHELPQLCETMRRDHSRAQQAIEKLPRGVRVPFDHLRRWADALEAS